MKLFNLDYYPRAKADLLEITVYYSAPDMPAAIASRFIKCVQETAQRLQHFPNLGHFYRANLPVAQELRCVPVDKFSQYLLFYAVASETIHVVRILHGVRNVHALLESDQ